MSAVRQAVADLLTAQDGVFAIAVRGGCMQPVLSDGVRVEVRGQRRYWPGDVVVFRNGGDQFICHRLLGYFPRAGRWWALTRADDAPHPDTPVPERWVLGRVVAVDERALRVTARHRLRAAGGWMRVVVYTIARRCKRVALTGVGRN